MLISFEGIDGCGKSTQISRLAHWLEERGHHTQTFREPGGTELSEAIRSLLLDRSSHIHPLAETLLFSAARAQLVSEKLQPLLKEGVVVILDRFYDSTTAYQGFGRRVLAPKKLESLHHLATDGTEPDITFYLRTDPVTAARRRQGNGDPDRMEEAGDAFFSRVCLGYDQLSEQHARVVTVDGTMEEQHVFSQICSKLLERFPQI